MLLLLFETSDGRYALDSQHIVEIIPLLLPKKIPGAPGYVSGIINYRGQPVPVFDLCALAGGAPCRLYYSSRIILVHYPLADEQQRDDLHDMARIQRITAIAGFKKQQQHGFRLRQP